MIRHALIILLSIFIAASTPHLLVTLEFSNENTHIQSYEWTHQLDATRNTGPYMMQLENPAGTIISQTQFSPYIHTQQETSQIQQLTIPIRAELTASSIHVYDELGKRISSQNIQRFCGDGLCESAEEDTCPQDCSRKQTHQVSQTTDTYSIALLVLITIVLSILFVVYKTRKQTL